MRAHLLLALLLPLAVGCSGDGLDKEASCAEINKTIEALGQNPAMNPTPGTSGDSGPVNVEAFARTYTDTAKKIRATAARTDDDDVRTSATAVADALDNLTKSVTTPTPTGPETVNASTRLATAAETFQKTCGTPPPVQ